MNATARHIEVWLDETSDSRKPGAYCVSICNEDGEETKLLSTHRKRTAAEKAAKIAGRKLGYTCGYRSRHGNLSTL